MIRVPRKQNQSLKKQDGKKEELKIQMSAGSDLFYSLICIEVKT
jgi:hypothetical protein